MHPHHHLCKENVCVLLSEYAAVGRLCANSFFFLSPSLCLCRSSQPCGLCVTSCCCASRLPYLEPCAFDRGHPSRSWCKVKQRSTTTSPKFAAASSPLLCISSPSQRSPSQPEDGGTMLLSLLSQPQRRRLIPFFFFFFS